MASRFPSSLGSRIAALGVAFVLLTCALGLLTYGIVHESIEQHLDTRTKAEAEALIAGGGDWRGVLRAVEARERTHTAGDLGYIVLDAQGGRVGGTLDAEAPAPGYTEFLHYRAGTGAKGIAQAYNAQIPSGGRLIVAADREAVDAMDRMLAMLFGGATALIVLAGLFAAVLVRRAVNRRLARIGAAAEAIMSGDLSQRMPRLGDAEFDQVATVINQMLERIERLLGNLRQVSTDLAHDIRSPLNRVRSSLEHLTAIEGEASSDLAAATIGEIDDLVDLLNGILGIAEIEGFAVRQRFKRLDVGRLAADLFDGYRPAIEAGGMAAVLAVGEPTWILGDAALLRRALANLIDNALIHGAGATRIELRVEADGEGLCSVSVSDDGAGVPPEAREAVFRRFVRLEESRSRPGHGLGLNMVMAIALAHHGTARAVARQTGTSIELSLPLASPIAPIAADVATADPR